MKTVFGLALALVLACGSLAMAGGPHHHHHHGGSSFSFSFGGAYPAYPVYRPYYGPAYYPAPAPVYPVYTPYVAPYYAYPAYAPPVVVAPPPMPGPATGFSFSVGR